MIKQDEKFLFVFDYNWQISKINLKLNLEKKGIISLTNKNVYRIKKIKENKGFIFLLLLYFF